MKCYQCGGKISKQDIYCPNCGVLIERKNKAKLYATITILVISMGIGYIYLDVRNVKNEKSSDGSKNEETIVTELKTSNFPSRELLKEGFYLEYEENLNDLLGTVSINSWKVSLVNEDTILFEITYHTDTEYRVICNSFGKGESFSSLYQGEGSTNSIFPDETVMKFRIPKSVYMDDFTEGFNIVVTDNFNFTQSLETGSVRTKGSAVAVP